jgi:hypothetical protein
MSCIASLFSFWNGPAGWFEELSIASARAVGHSITVFAYGEPDPRLKAAGADVADARLLWPMADGDHRRLQGKPAYFSDQLRLEGLAQSVGVWVDLDCIFARPLQMRDYIFARESMEPSASIGNSVLHLPANEPVLDELLAFYRRRPFCPIAPHWSTWKQFQKWVEWKTEPFLRPDKVKTVAGPHVLTAALTKHQLTEQAWSTNGLYPLQRLNTKLALRPGPTPKELMSPNVVLAHLWGKGQGLSGPIPGSWLGDIAEGVGFPLAPESTAVT